MMVGLKPLQINVSNKPSPHWDHFVNKNQGSKIYHLAEWNQVIHRTFGHKNYFVEFKSNNAVLGILPLTQFKSPVFGKFAVSLPFVNYGGAIFTEELSYRSLEEFLFQFRQKLGVDFLELRLDEEKELSLPVKKHKVTFLLNLPQTEEELWKSFKAKLRSQIRRPQKENMFAISGGFNLLNDYYYIFSRNMRDLGTPVYCKKLFQNILESFPHNAFIVAVYNREKLPVAASLLLTFKGTMEIPWASSLREFNRFSPNMLLYWESLKLAITQKCHTFDFGRCTPESGTYRFKKQWGATEKQLYWYYVLSEKQQNLPELNPSNQKFEFLINVWRKLPLFLTNSIGPYIIRNIP